MTLCDHIYIFTDGTQLWISSSEKCIKNKQSKTSVQNCLIFFDTDRLSQRFFHRSCGRSFQPHLSSDFFHIIIVGTENQGGFRG